MKKWLLRFLAFAFFAFAGRLAFMTAEEQKPYYEAEMKQKALAAAAVTEAGKDAEAADAPVQPFPNTFPGASNLDRVIDFGLLKSINPDIIGWIYAPGIDVDHPILKGERYLNTDFEGNYNPLGSIFTWSSAKLSDSHICLFGHDMVSGQMFGKLKKYRNTDFQQTNPYVYIYTPLKARELALSSVFICEATNGIFGKDWGTGNAQTFTLVTCSGNYHTRNRLTVTFSVVKEKIYL